MKNFGIKAFVLTVAILSSAAFASADSLVTNGNFTPPAGWTSSSIGAYQYQPAGFGWTFTGGSGVTQNQSAWGFSNAPNGDTQVDFLQNVSDASQTISNLTVGDQYALSFYLEQRPAYGQNPVTSAIGSTSFSAITPLYDGAWHQYTESFTATASSEVLSFSTNIPWGDNDTGLSDVSITGTTPAAVTPEPGSFMLLGSGLLGMVGAVRRKFARKA